MATMPPKGQLHVWHAGRRGRILTYSRPGGRCPSADFLEAAPTNLTKRLFRSFDRFGDVGMDSADNGAFKPLVKDGKGLWAFKEHDHRLLCFRGPDCGLPPRQQIVLLCGWVKDKDDSLEERKQIARAHALREECERTVDWSAVIASRVPKGRMALLREDLAEPLFTPEYHASIIEAAPALAGPPTAAKGPAHPPPKPVVHVPPMDPLPKPEVPVKKEPLTIVQLAALADVPYKWLWLEVNQGRVSGWTTDTAKRKVWSWDGIDRVVARIQECRRTNRTIQPNRKPKQPKQRTVVQTMQETAQANCDLVTQMVKAAPNHDLFAPHDLLTLARAARLINVSKGVLRKAVAAGEIKPATIRDGVRRFDRRDVWRWKERAVVATHPLLPLPLPPVGPPVEPAPVPLLAPLLAKVQSKAAMRTWLDDLLSGKRDDGTDFVIAIREHLEYRKKLEAELQALSDE